MQRKFPVVIDDRMPCVCASLKTHDDVGLFRQRIRYLPFSFISPVRSHDCLYHAQIPPKIIFPRRPGEAPQEKYITNIS